MTGGRLEHCICCGEGGAPGSAIYAGLLRCGVCGHVWYPDLPETGEISAIYGTGYFEGEEYLDYARERPALERNFRPRLRALTERFAAGSRLFEIGAAYGFFLEAASGHFRAEGCDVSAHAVAHAVERLGPVVRCGDYLELAVEPTSADVVCMWDTIEHLARPDLVLGKVLGQLRQGGQVVISTGDIGSRMARWRGAKWRLIHPPSHLHYFSARSIAVLLGRLGFGVAVVRHPAFWRSADAVAFRLLAHPPGRATGGVYRALHGAGLLKFAFPLNLGDLMEVVAEAG